MFFFLFQCCVQSHDNNSQKLESGKLAKKRDFKAYWNIVLKGIWKQIEKVPDQQAKEKAEVISESVIEYIVISMCHVKDLSTMWSQIVKVK